MTMTAAPVRPKPRKEEILDVATVLFAERGFDGTSMNDVAERVGMRKASLFYHFATKDSLYEAVLDRLVREVGETLQAVYAGQGTLVERLEGAAEAVVSAFSGRPFAARLLLREAMDWGPVIRGKLLDTVLVVLESGAAFIEAGQREGVFIQGDPKQIILTALGAQILPFAIVQLVERYVGADPFGATYLEARRIALRTQVRNMIVAPRILES
jgi:AcrR family transcriptional regulator